MESSEQFLELVRQHGDKAYNFAYRLAGNEADAKDLVQEALVRAFEHRESYEPGRPFESWLFKILQNVYLDAVRRYGPRHTVSLDAAPPSGESRGWEDLLPGQEPGPADVALRHERDQLLQKALETLPIHYRSAVTLSDVEGLSYEEIGRIMACPVGTVRSRIHQGRVLLKKAFERLERGGVHERAS